MKAEKNKCLWRRNSKKGMKKVEVTVLFDEGKIIIGEES